MDLQINRLNIIKSLERHIHIWKLDILHGGIQDQFKKIQLTKLKKNDLYVKNCKKLDPYLILYTQENPDRLRT